SRPRTSRSSTSCGARSTRDEHRTVTLAVFHAPDIADAAVGGSVAISGDEARHAVVVRRLRVGEKVALTDGAGTLAVCTVTGTTKGSLSATVDEMRQVRAERPRVVVVQAVPKGDRGEL